jgi:glycosyltransferase involved in cell wall biosynthesis
MKAIFENSYLPFEIIVVDNKSIDSTYSICSKKLQENCVKANIKYTLLVNEIPGVANSRYLGILASKGDVSIFVDDDNILSKTYIEYVRDFFLDHDSVYMLCSRGCLPRNIHVPLGFKEENLGHYAIGSIISKTGSILDKEFLWSAGLAFRTRSMQSFFHHGLRLRCGQIKNIMAGEDTEIFQWYRIKGLDVWFTVENVFEHYIDPARFEVDYFQRLRETQIRSNELLQKYYGGIIRFSLYKRKLFRKFTFYDARQTLRGLLQMIARPGQFITWLKILSL